jgi:hypothetical protein
MARSLKLNPQGWNEMRSGKWWDRESWQVDERAIAPLEHQLTMHLERAHLLAERAQRSNGAAQRAIDRARAIADELTEINKKK